MFEKRLKELSSKLNHPERTYFILTHKKHKREVYFQNTNKAIKFLRIKFDPSVKKFKTIKKIIYLLIKIRILQIFLKKIRLSSDFGDVVFVGDQIKGFNLNKKMVFSFIRSGSERDRFIKSKKLQKELSKKKLAPEIIELNLKIPFSKEELLKSYKGNNYVDVFKKLYSFYEEQGIEKIPLKKYVNFLIKELEEKGIRERVFREILRKLAKDKKSLLVARVHGDFSEEQILLKKGSYVFTDWDTYEKKLKKNLITRDLASFFRENENLLKEKLFQRLLRIYPQEVRKNIKTYLILNDIYNVARRKGYLELSKKRIKNILKQG